MATPVVDLARARAGASDKEVSKSRSRSPRPSQSRDETDEDDEASEKSSSSVMASASMLRNSMNGESIFNFMHGSKPDADGVKTAADDDDEDSDYLALMQWDPDAPRDEVLKELPEYMQHSEAGS